MTQENIVAITGIATGSTGLLIFLLYAVKQFVIDHRANDADMKAERDLARRERDELRDELDGVRAEVVTALRDSNTGLALSADGVARLAKVVDKNADGMDRMGKVVDKLVREAKVVKLP